MERSEYAWHAHGHVNEYIRFADAKAGTVIVSSTGLLAALYSAKIHHEMLNHSILEWGSAAWFGALGLLLLILSVFFGVLAVIPRSRGGQSKGYIYFESICRHGGETAFASQYLAQDDSQRLDHLLHNLYSVAEIASQKYKWVRLALVCVIIGGLISGASLLLSN